MGMRHSVHSIFYDQADAHEAAGDWDRALELLYQAHRWTPDDPALWLRLGLLSLRMADRAWLESRGLAGSHVGDRAALDAEVYLERASRLAATEAPPPFWRAWALFLTRADRAPVRAMLDEAERRNPRWPYTGVLRARLALADREPGYPSDALTALRGPLALLPESPRFQYDWGAALAAAGDPKAAFAAFSRAVSLPPLPPGQGTAGAWLDEAFHGQPAQLRTWVETYFADVLEAVASPLPAAGGRGLTG